MTTQLTMPKPIRGRNKYGAVKTIVDGVIFDSKAESKRYGELRLLEKAGEISGLVLQPAYVLQSGFKRDGVSYRPILYIADFKYIDCKTGKQIIEDCKGMRTEVYKLKKKLLLCDLPAEVEFREVR